MGEEGFQTLIWQEGLFIYHETRSHLREWLWVLVVGVSIGYHCPSPTTKTLLLVPCRVETVGKAR